MLGFSCRPCFVSDMFGRLWMTGFSCRIRLILLRRWLRCLRWLHRLVCTSSTRHPGVPADPEGGGGGGGWGGAPDGGLGMFCLRFFLLRSSAKSFSSSSALSTFIDHSKDSYSWWCASCALCWSDSNILWCSRSFISKVDKSLKRALSGASMACFTAIDTCSSMASLTSGLMLRFSSLVILDPWCLMT